MATFQAERELERIPYRGAQGNVCTNLGTPRKAERFSILAINVAVPRGRVKPGAIAINSRDLEGTIISKVESIIFGAGIGNVIQVAMMDLVKEFGADAPKVRIVAFSAVVIEATRQQAHVRSVRSWIAELVLLFFFWYTFLVFVVAQDTLLPR